jgi:signal recognition particle receptor subunit alpha
VNALVGQLVEQRSGEAQFVYTPALGGGSYSIKWTLNNSLGIVFAIIYQKSLSLPYSVDDLLCRVAKAFVKEFPLVDGTGVYDFDCTFDTLLRDAEKVDTSRHGVGGTLGPHCTDKSSGNGMVNTAPTNPVAGRGGDPDSRANIDEDTGSPDKNVSQISEKPSAAFDSAMLSQKFAKKKKVPQGKVSGGKGKGSKTGKKARNWNELDGIHATNEEKALEFVDGGPPEESQVLASFAKASLVDAVDDVESDDDDDETENRQKSGFLSSFVRSLGMGVVGTDALTRADVDQFLEDLKKKLMERNVAEEIACKLVDSVANSLIGSKLASFSRVSSAVRQAMEEALTRILTPRKPIDILRGIKEAKSRGRPFVITFVGVNGVGKSTSLAKVAYYLKQHNHRVMVAACDTFRSGAVEQVKVHSQRLDLSFYARGYEKDPAKVAGEAIRAAQKEGCDVVLVDTAGRMQNNEPLMRAITSLVTMNEPDLVLFVGEALAGNDSVDQLVHFNKALATFSNQPQPHVIDGLVISKFETVDDKIGTAISMVYSSGAPIAFLGVGQQYTDLKRVDVRSLVKTLLK